MTVLIYIVIGYILGRATEAQIRAVYRRGYRAGQTANTKRTALPVQGFTQMRGIPEDSTPTNIDTTLLTTALEHAKNTGKGTVYLKRGCL